LIKNFAQLSLILLKKVFTSPTWWLSRECHTTNFLII